VVLAHAFLRKFGAQQGRSRRGFSDDALQAIAAYDWPGNVRELENKVKTALIMAEGPLITAADLGLAPHQGTEYVFNLKEVRARAEKLAVHQAMIVADGNVSRAAELLGITRPTLYDLLDKFGMRQPEQVAGN
jgi:two-component system NtrC family response regulator